MGGGGCWGGGGGGGGGGLLKQHVSGRYFDKGVVFSVKSVRCRGSDFDGRFWIISLHNETNALMGNLIQM